MSSDDPFHSIVHSIDSGDNCFISGVGGCGKSYILKQIYNHYINRKVKCVLTSTTGISAYNLGGITIHSWSRIVIPSKIPDIERWAGNLVKKLKRNSRVRKYYQNTSIIFIDEVSMLGANYLDVFNYVCQEIRDCQEPFGGIQLVLSGDMMQLPPVKDAFPFESATWPTLQLKYFKLIKSWRFDNQYWVDLLNRARLGTLTKFDEQTLYSKINRSKEGCEIEPIFLASVNDVVDDINSSKLDEIKDVTQIFMSKDYIAIKDNEDNIINMIETTFNEDISKQFMIEPYVKLKVGAQVMLLANLDVPSGYTNGTRGIVKKIPNNEVVLVQFEVGTREISMHSFMVDYLDTTFIRQGIPLKLAFATSIHKSQSLTLNSVEIDIGEDVFCKGQSYVALSRCRSLDGLYIRSLDVTKVKPDPKALKFEKDFSKKCTEL
jgi:ATP-dependent DNA helicase PIF1